MNSRILLVEDNVDDVALTRRAFRKAGLEGKLGVVEDGELAVRYLSGQDPFGDRDRHPLPALVLLDWKLPGWSGSEVLRWIRARQEFAALPVVVLTSSRLPEDIDAAYRAGANSYVEKPVQFADLHELVGQLHRYWLETNVSGPGPIP